MRADPGRALPVPLSDRTKLGATPEEIWGPKQVYTMHVNMPNLASATGSWVMSFVELWSVEEAQGSPVVTDSGLTGPVPLRKVDPRYPPALFAARVEGEVVLYAVIRKDGSVDSIQLVKGVEPQLDLNAMEALARWRFRPAQRKGVAVELEAIVHIPFRAVDRLD
jgi:protein TonB